jgi:cytochrome P450
MASSTPWRGGDIVAPLPPRVPGLPVLGNALSFMGDPLSFLTASYQQHGPIYRVRALARQMTVLAGPEANQFLARAGEDFLTSKDLFGGFASEMNTDVFLVALDGPPHRHLRKVMRRGFSKEAVGPHAGHFMEIAANAAQAWQPGARIAVLPTLQRIVTEQLGLAIAGRAPGEYFDAIVQFLNTIMRARVLRMWPAFVLRLPSYKRAKARVYELGDQVIAAHRQQPAGAERPPDLIDDMMNARDENGNPFDDHAVRVTAIAAFFAGIDTVANTLTFMLYALLKDPETLERVRAEADRLEPAAVPELHQLKQYEALYGTVLETLRMYPVAAFTPRTATQPFEFMGHRVDRGQEVIVANGVTHMLPQFFPQPGKFDIDRYRAPRNEHRQANAFAPYSLGAHTCLGAGLAEVQMMLTLAALLRTVHLELDPPDYRVRVRLAPLPSAGQDFKVRVVGHLR